MFSVKPKAAYEVRIRDWSSDVCSPDLLAGDTADGFHHQPVADRQVARDAERHKGHGIFERHVPLAWPIGLGIFGVERRCLVSFILYRVASDQRSNGSLD